MFFLVLSVVFSSFANRAHLSEPSSRPEVKIDIPGSNPLIKKSAPFKALFEKEMLVMKDPQGRPAKEPLGEIIEEATPLLSDIFKVQEDKKNKVKLDIANAINQRVKNKMTTDVDQIKFRPFENTAFVAGHLVIEDRKNKRLFLVSKDGKGLISFGEDEVMNFFFVEKPKQRLVIVSREDKKYSAWFFSEDAPRQELSVNPILGHDFNSGSSLVKFTYFQGEKGKHVLELDADFDKTERLPFLRLIEQLNQKTPVNV